MSLWAACLTCDYRELVPDDLPGLDALRRGEDLAREHVLVQHFELKQPESSK